MWLSSFLHGKLVNIEVKLTDWATHKKKIKRLIDYFSFEHGRLGKNGNFRLFCEFRVHKSENKK